MILETIPAEIPTEDLCLLSENERSRLHRIKHPATACVFVAGRGLIRRILGAMTAIHPDEQRLGLQGGRPYLIDEWPQLDFSLSHGGNWLCLAIGCGITIGADIEPLPDAEHVLDIASMVFSRRERCLLDQLDGSARAATFCRLWARREVSLKYAGVGLAGNNHLVSYLRVP